MSRCPLRWLPGRVRTTGPRPHLDLPGSGLIGLAVLLVLLPFIQGSWGAWRWWLLPASAAAAAAFTLRESRATDPLLDLSLFRNPSYTAGVAVVTFYFGALTPVFYIATFLLQQGQGYSAIESGLTLTPFAVGSAMAGAAADGHGTGWGTLSAAAGLYQTGQRIGSSIGLAAVGWAFYAGLRTGGSFITAYRHGSYVISAILAAALLLAISDRIRARTRPVPAAQPHPRHTSATPG